MGNCCADAYYNKHKPQTFEMHMIEFSKTYRPLKFPENLAFTHDPGLFRMRNTLNRQLLMLKRLDFPSETDLTRFLKRLDRIMHFEHDSLLKIYHYAVEKNQLKDFTVCFTLNIVLETFEHTLQDELLFRTKSNQSFTEKEIRAYLNSLVDLLEFLQLKGISPESLKPSKIYISSNKQPKLLFVGDTSDSIMFDNYHPNQSYTHISSHFINPSMEVFFQDKTTNDILIPPNPFKSNVLALGLIILDMMSVNNIAMLNNPNKTIRQQYKAIEASGNYEMLLLGLVKTMLTADECGRPDFLEFKKIMLMEEYIDTTISRRSKKEVKTTNIEEPDSTKVLDSPGLDYKIELPLRIHLDSCDVTGLNLLEGMGAECAVKKVEEPTTLNINLEDLGHNLSPTKADTECINTARDGSSKKQESEDIFKMWEDVDEHIDNSLEIEILDLSDLSDVYNKKMTNLKKLRISLHGAALNKEITSKLGEIIEKQSFLSELTLEFPQAEIVEESLEIICNGINSLTNLTICYLDFRKMKITDKDLQRLGKCLLTKTHLIDLTLNISDSGISEQGCQEISQWFRKLKNLKSFALNLGGNKIENAGTRFLGKELVHMRELETVMIFLYENEIKGEEGVNAILKSLRKLEKLKKVSINLLDNYLEDSDIEVILNFAKESTVEEISINIKDNCVSENLTLRLENELASKQNVNIKF